MTTANSIRGPRSPRAIEPATPSLRGNFGCTFAGNSIYAAGQWATLSLFAKLGGTAMLGEYALALALTTPLVMLSHLNLRSLIATDAGHKYAFGDYFAVRVGTSMAAVVAMALVAALAAETWRFSTVVLIAGLGLLAETFSDLLHGALQRREQLNRVALSMIARTLLSLVALGITLWITADLLWAVAAITLARMAVLLFVDVRAGLQTEEWAPKKPRSRRAIFRHAIPLGLILMLISLNTNLPRYAIEQYLGVAELGVFAAVVSFITVGSTFMNALGQSATARLARHFHEGDFPAFRALLWRMGVMAVGLGTAGVVVAAVAGGLVLRLLYRPEFALYHRLLVGVMAAGALSYLAIALGYGVTSARIFDAQLPLFAASAICCGVASYLMVPHWGLAGAVGALAIAALPQIGGQLFLLTRALRRQGSPA